MTSRTCPSRRRDVLRRMLAFRRSAIGRLIAAAAAVVLGAAPLMAATTSTASTAEVLAQINGSGSTWAQPAIAQWINDVGPLGLQVSYNPQGSAQGRTDFRNGTTDFGVSDIGFLGTNPQDNSNDSNCTDPLNPNPALRGCRAFAYLPIAAGGTAFPYQIRVGGRLVENLRLSGETIAKIFTNQIRNWDDPEITKDNNGQRLPDLPIIPVMDSEGSGASYQFSAYLGQEFPSIWKPFNGSVAPTEFFPRKGSAIAEAGSDGIMNFITSAAGNGAIGYDQYSYPKGQSCQGCTSGWPVALLKNKAGWYVAPTQYNVAVALTKAIINTNKKSPNYLLQKLNNVYVDPDKRAYALSSYSYMIIPTGSTDPTMSQGKRQTLANYIDYAICQGQAQIGPIGYSPLPVNLAQASFAQMDKLHAADHAVQIANLNIAKQCHNPTFFAGHPDANLLAQIAPQPPSCDKSGVGPCPGETGVTATGNPLKGKAPPPAARAPGSGKKSSHHPGKTLIGVSIKVSASAAAAPPGANGTLANTKTIAASQDAGEGVALAIIAGLGALVLIAIPAVFAGRRQQRRAVR